MVSAPALFWVVSGPIGNGSGASFQRSYDHWLIVRGQRDVMASGTSGVCGIARLSPFYRSLVVFMIA
jgi:hypothetical protein